ncbi:MAG: hypothetical protein HZB75_01960 [Candidatus Saccharibacteria bacterium]|nr:MAG: hypothetical protein HZB75_01960 [Candidatus Saccharibacteria bacterium]
MKTKTQDIAFGRYIWGLTLVTIGVLALLQYYNIVVIDGESVARMWPLLIVFSGISLLSVRSWLWGSTVMLLIVTLLAGAVAIATGYLQPPAAQQSANSSVTVAKPDTDVHMINLLIKNAAGKLKIDSDTEGSLVRAAYGGELRHNETLKDGTQTIDLEATNNTNWWLGSSNDLNVTMNETIATDVTLSSGAANVDADFSRVPLHVLTIKSGASSNTIKLGQKTKATTIHLDTGVSSIELLIPRGAGIHNTVESGVSNISIPDMHEISKGIYETTGYDLADQKIRLEGKIGMANLKITYY